MQSCSQIALLTCSPGTDKRYVTHWKSQKCQPQLPFGRMTNQTTIIKYSLKKILKKNANTSTSSLINFKQ